MPRSRRDGNATVSAPRRRRARHRDSLNPDHRSRRLAAITFVDIVGYSILMSQQEAATHARWMALLREIIHPALARHRGSFVKSTGDGLLAEFPSAVDALDWAIEI